MSVDDWWWEKMPRVMAGEDHYSTEYSDGIIEGAAMAFGLMGMAYAIREYYCMVCHACGYVAHNEHPCQCWNDE